MSSWYKQSNDEVKIISSDDLRRYRLRSEIAASSYIEQLVDHYNGLLRGFFGDSFIEPMKISDVKNSFESKYVWDVDTTKSRVTSIELIPNTLIGIFSWQCDLIINDKSIGERSVCVSFEISVYANKITARVVYPSGQSTKRVFPWKTDRLTLREPFIL